jgi:hypothetical protein
VRGNVGERVLEKGLGYLGYLGFRLLKSHGRIKQDMEVCGRRTTVGASRKAEVCISAAL